MSGTTSRAGARYEPSAKIAKRPAAAPNAAKGFVRDGIGAGDSGSGEDGVSGAVVSACCMFRGGKRLPEKVPSTDELLAPPIQTNEQERGASVTAATAKTLAFG